ncbi:hypothetical protein ABFT23_01660, partial [Nocardioides sp. C4-1]|uniref:hypothetical protein n=1 Tax=Nocardioides sp. C4-1 TaxID=3151851 RepID=UPI0032652993
MVDLRDAQEVDQVSNYPDAAHDTVIDMTASSGGAPRVRRSQRRQPASRSEATISAILATAASSSPATS